MGRHCPTPPPRVLASCAAVACFASGGGCPSGAWKETTAVDVAASAGSRDALVLVNAGANKGYAVGEWAQRFGGASFSNNDWLTNLTAIKPNMMLRCGYCGACRASNPVPILHPGGVHAYAVELLDTNALVLRMMMERMRLSSDVVTVHEIALSNYSGVAYSPSVHRTGQEDVQASSTASRGHGKRVESLTLEDFAARQRIQTIHTLSLDAEGWDPRILRGAASLLRARRIELLEFEYAPKAWAGALGLWTLWSHRLSADEEARIKAGSRLHPALPPVMRELIETVAWLREMGYECFWQGREANTLIDATRASIEACHDAIASVAQGNLACAPAGSAVLARLRTMRLPVRMAPAQG